MTAERGWAVVQHVPFEGPGLIAEVAAQGGIELQPCHPYRGDPLPAKDEIAGLVVMGGPMSVSDTAEHPHLARESKLIAAMVDAGRPVLGVCLGAHLLAHSLGGAVYRARRVLSEPQRVRSRTRGIPLSSAALYSTRSERGEQPGIRPRAVLRLSRAPP